MKWKDFFYYSERERRGILLLLILMVVVIAFRLLSEKWAPPPTQASESDSLKAAFTEFQRNLIEDEREEQSRAYEQRKHTFYEKYKRNYIPYSTPSSGKADHPAPAFQKQEKFLSGQSLSINDADTSDWKKVPGIGSAYAKRIVKYRDLLGGFVAIEQLKEVYGFSDELFFQVKPFVKMDTRVKKLAVNQLTAHQFSAHPYFSFKQAKTLVDLRQRRGKISSIQTLQMLDEFSEEDIRRLGPYLSFE